MSLRDIWRCRPSKSVRLESVRREAPEPPDSRNPASLTGVHDADRPDLPDLLRCTCITTKRPLGLTRDELTVLVLREPFPTQRSKLSLGCSPGWHLTRGRSHT